MNIEFWDIVLITIIIGAFGVCLYGLKMVIKEGFLKQWNLFAGFVFGSLLVSYLIYNVISHEIDPKDWALIFLTLGLVMVTGLYALVSFRQANASMEMAEEMREQRILSSRPVMIQRAVHEGDIYEGSTSDLFSHFEIYNAGNGPAIEVEISLLMPDKESSMHSHRHTFVKAGESPLRFDPYTLGSLVESSTYFVVCEYQSAFPRGEQRIWYQTWLPFKIVKSSTEHKVYVNAGELQFLEATAKLKINAFRSEEKPHD